MPRRRASSCREAGRRARASASRIPTSRGPSSGSPPRAAPASTRARPRARSRATRARTAGFSPRTTSRAQRSRVGRAAQRTLPRGHHLRDAAADPGPLRAPDAEPARALRSRRRSTYLGPDHVHLLVQAKQIAFHDRDRFVADPDFVHGAGRAAALPRVCRRAPAADRPAARAAVGPRARPGAASPATPCTWRRSTRAATRRRSSTASTATTARAWWPGAPASCSRTAAPTSRSTPRIRTGSSRASARCTP